MHIEFGLSNAAAINYKKPFIKNNSSVTICPGPNIVNFNKVVSLSTMVDHIYGRDNIMSNSNRSHMFINELKLYIDYLVEQLIEAKDLDENAKKKKSMHNYCENLLQGINYYKVMAEKHFDDKFNTELFEAEKEIKKITALHLD